jgi:hypothetical protein
MLPQTTQEQKRLLESFMGKRLLSDSAFYRLRKNLKQIGISENDYSAVFPLIGEMNRNRSKIAYLSPDFKAIWEKLRVLSVSKTMTCAEFQKYLEISLPEEFKPKDRYIQGKFIGLSGTWYNWFRQAGIPYQKDTKYDFSKYLIVAGLAYSWVFHKQEKARKTEVQAVTFENV